MRVRLIGSSPYEALLLPDTAIATDQSRKIVFVVKDDNTVEAKPVTLGPLDIHAKFVALLACRRFGVRLGIDVGVQTQRDGGDFLH